MLGLLTEANKFSLVCVLPLSVSASLSFPKEKCTYGKLAQQEDTHIHEDNGGKSRGRDKQEVKRETQESDGVIMSKGQ